MVVEVEVVEGCCVAVLWRGAARRRLIYTTGALRHVRRASLRRFGVAPHCPQKNRSASSSCSQESSLFSSRRHSSVEGHAAVLGVQDKVLVVFIHCFPHDSDSRRDDTDGSRTLRVKAGRDRTLRNHGPQGRLPVGSAGGAFYFLKALSLQEGKPFQKQVYCVSYTQAKALLPSS